MKPFQFLCVTLAVALLKTVTLAADPTGTRAPLAAPAASADAAVSSAKTIESDPVPLNALEAALEKEDYKFTPQVRAAFLAERKAQAMTEIARAGQSVPAEFLAWVDSDPGVASTIYGVENPSSRLMNSKGSRKSFKGSDGPARRLVLLRSLELDLGKQIVRNEYPQLALAMTDTHAGLVDLKTMSNEKEGISLKERGLLKLEIKRFPCEKVNTRDKNRRLDIHDHIINFLEDNPVTVTTDGVKVVDGKKVKTVGSYQRNLHAYEVYGNPEMLKTFNAYMTERGFPMALDCKEGKIIPTHWGGARDISKAYELFRTAYEEKGRLPKALDPKPTPAELAAYLIRNDQHRFPKGSKHSWPKFPLNARWPVLYYLCGSTESLREREYVWNRFCDGARVPAYGKNAKVAQYPHLVKASKLQSFDFTYETYPMRLKDGGVCGTHSNIGRFANTALGVPAGQASQPGHSCLVRVTGNEQRGYGLAIEQDSKGPKATFVSGRGNYYDEVIHFYPINYGLQEYLDTRSALLLLKHLPATAPPKARLSLLRSAFEINPYNLQVASGIVNTLGNQDDLAAFWQHFVKTIAAVQKPGCPQNGHYNAAVQKVFNARLTQLPSTSGSPGRAFNIFWHTRRGHLAQWDNDAP